MTGADDWTVEIETKGLPELKQIYKMYGAEDKVMAKYLKFPHNYNQPSREVMYNFFNQHIIAEPPAAVLMPAQPNLPFPRILPRLRQRLRGAPQWEEVRPAPASLAVIKETPFTPVDP